MPVNLLLLSVSMLSGTLQQQPAAIRTSLHHAAAPAPAVAVVWGQVRSERTGAPLRTATVEVLGAQGFEILAETDTNGIYILHGVPHGRRVVRATHIDHAPHEIELVVVGERQIVDFDLELRPVRLPTVNARGTANPAAAIRDTLSVGMPELSAAAARAMESSPGMAEMGLAEAAKEVPGFEPLDPSDVLFVRGGAADLKLVLLNGAPVYAPFHIGGLIQALDADVLRSATLHAGGAPARYDGGLSYVMDLETRSGRNSQPRARLAADMLAANATLEGPLTSSITYLVSGRAVHGAGTGPFFASSFPYGYADGVARIDFALGDSAGITVSGFWNEESVLLDTIDARRQVAEWGNEAASIRYRGRMRGTDLVLTFGSGEFRTGLPLGGKRPLLTEGIADRTRVAADLERSVGAVRVQFGGSFDRQGFEYRASTRPPADTLLIRARAEGDVAGAYIDGTLDVLNRVRLRGGLRADVFSIDPEVRLAPRLAATVLLTGRASLTVAGGRYRQYVRAPERGLVFLGAPAADSAGANALVIADATHLLLGLSQDLGEGIRLGLEGFYKEFENLPSVTSGDAQASGVDLWVRRGAGDYRGWLSYSLAWVWSSNEAPRAAQMFAGRHLISVGLAGPTIAGGAFDVRVSYGAGLPYTAIPEPEVAAPAFNTIYSGPSVGTVPDGGNLVTDPDQPYLRIDAELERTWRGRLIDRDFEITPYLKVLNALNRRDAMFYHFDRDNNAAEPLAGLPVLPVVGVEWSF